MFLLRSIARAIFGKPEVRKPDPPEHRLHSESFITHWHNAGKPPLACHTSLGMFDSVFYHVTFDAHGVRCRTMFEGAAGVEPYIGSTGKFVADVDPVFAAAMLDAPRDLS